MKVPKFLFKARENLVEKNWGGYWIPELKGIRVSKRVGESWEFSAHPSMPSEVLINDIKVKLPDLVSRARREILGRLSNKEFPILVKLLDVNTRLSVQVHPSDYVANLLGEKERGKEEGWIALSQGKVYIGLKDYFSEEYAELEIISKMRDFEANFLDTFIIPAGTVHFAEGIKLLEVSTNSNITYRIFDFEGRETHIDKAMKAMNFVEGEFRCERGKLEMKEFGLEAIKARESVYLETNGVFNIIFSLDEDIFLRSGNEEVKLRKGYSCLVPAKTKEYEVIGRSTIIRVYPRC